MADQLEQNIIVPNTSPLVTTNELVVVLNVEHCLCNTPLGSIDRTAAGTPLLPPAQPAVPPAPA